MIHFFRDLTKLNMISQNQLTESDRYSRIPTTPPLVRHHRHVPSSAISRQRQILYYKEAQTRVGDASIRLDRDPTNASRKDTCIDCNFSTSSRIQLFLLKWWRVRKTIKTLIINVCCLLEFPWFNVHLCSLMEIYGFNTGFQECRKTRFLSISFDNAEIAEVGVCLCSKKICRIASEF